MNALEPAWNRLYEDLAFLYGDAIASTVHDRLKRKLSGFRKASFTGVVNARTSRFSEQDLILISYGDMVQEASEAPLRTLARFLGRHVAGIVNTVHVLPFFPSSSDDGFSVIDYKKVDPSLGTWEDIAKIGVNFRLMFDAVINHVSSQSNWFQAFLQDDPQYRDYFTVVEEGADLSKVFRPRNLPLLTRANTIAGPKLVWTTFSADQIDLNYRNPDLLLEVIDALLYYVAKGAEFIRLDAIAYLWKEPGTESIHRPQTHRIVHLIRGILNIVAPHVSLVTETNVPHVQNVSYFGDGTNEAQMVYNFALPPLTLHAFHTGNATRLSQWADSLQLPSDQVTFLNFLASHDGIGLMPVQDLLSQVDIGAMAQWVKDLGGHVSLRAGSDGSSHAYELNLSYLDALALPGRAIEDSELVARRFLASQAIMLALRGVPGIYFHSLFGSRSWFDGVRRTGRARSINREKLSADRLEQELSDSTTLRHRVFHGYAHMLRLRKSNAAFHPGAPQKIVFLHDALFCVLRSAPDGSRQVLCLQNVSNQRVHLTVDLGKLLLSPSPLLRELISGCEYTADLDGRLDLSVEPYGVLWLT